MTFKLLFLGFIISKYGIHTYPKKVQAILELMTPILVLDLQSFMGI